MAVFTMTVYITIYDIQNYYSKSYYLQVQDYKSEILIIYCKSVYRRNARGRSPELLFEKYYCILQKCVTGKVYLPYAGSTLQV